jgi:hypothetical protein
MPNPLDRLNETANARFAELKQKLMAKSRELPKTKRPEVDTEKLQQLLNRSTPLESKKTIENSGTDLLDRIDALELHSPNLALAVSFIAIAVLKPETRVESLQKAITILETEL